MRLTHPQQRALARLLKLGDGCTAFILDVRPSTLYALESAGLVDGTREATPVWSLTADGRKAAQEMTTNDR